jgi:branched-subunit amino acid ABC-type transport system permease component
MVEFLQHIINGLGLGAIYALIALGYTMVFGILQLINFAHSDVYMVGAFIGYYAARTLGLSQNPGFLSLLTALVLAMAGCAALGFCIERFAYRPLRRAPPHQRFDYGNWRVVAFRVWRPNFVWSRSEVFSNFDFNECRRRFDYDW